MNINTDNIQIVLASGSPRRIEMFRTHGIDPLVMPVDVDETIPLGLGAAEAVVYLAVLKAATAAARFNSARFNATRFNAAAKLNASAKFTAAPHSIIIAADTVVCKAGRILGKPANEAEALEMYELLRATNHFVYTGVAVIDPRSGNTRAFRETTEVFFKDYSKAEMLEYIATGNPFDKAGGYGFQGIFRKYIDHIEGDADNVIGFPWTRFELEVSEMGSGTESG